MGEALRVERVRVRVVWMGLFAATLAGKHGEKAVLVRLSHGGPADRRTAGQLVVDGEDACVVGGVKLSGRGAPLELCELFELLASKHDKTGERGWTEELTF